MPNHSEEFRLLSVRFDALVRGLGESQTLEERTQIFRAMKLVIDRIDELIFSTLNPDEPR